MLRRPLRDFLASEKTDRLSSEWSAAPGQSPPPIKLK